MYDFYTYYYTRFFKKINMFMLFFCDIIVSRMGKIARYLNQLIVGNVFDSPEIIEAYSTDRSALKIKPRAVAFPESTDDLQRLMRFCYQLAAKDIKIPVAVRGSGLDEMGGDLSNGLVISTEKLNRLLESDRRERLVRVQAGITLKELNTALSVNGLAIPVGGHELETIGGLISNCPIDDFAGKYGGIMNYVERVEVVLPNGDCLQTCRLNKHAIDRKAHEKSLEGEIYRKLPKILQNNEELLKELKNDKFGKHGYSNIKQASHRESINLLPLFFGAEGTLGVISEVILRATPINCQYGRVAATFVDIKVAQKFLDMLKPLRPCELNLYDVKMIKTVEEMGKRVNEITKKMETGFVVLARFDSKSKAYVRRINSIIKLLPRTSRILIDTNRSMVAIDELENSLTSFIYYAKDGERVPLLTDFYIPSDHLEDFIEDIKVIEEKLELDLALFGSYLNNIYSLRPKFSISDEDFNKKATTFLRAGAYAIERRGGAVVAGGPEGRIKSIVTNTKMTEAEKKLYEEIKNLFDRYGIASPDTKIGTDARFTMRHFRSSSSSKIMI